VFIAALDPGAAVIARGPATNISNSPGYDNQPGFLPDGSGVLFSSQRDGKQMDIYRYDFASQSLTQVTKTPEGEYSPQVTPDGKTFSVIRVEADGTQRLWRFQLGGSDPQVVLPDVKPVGYHAWIDRTRLALFVLGGAGRPATLQLADTTTGKAEVIEERIGRSLHLRPGTGTVSFVSKPQGGPWVVKELNPATKEVRPLIETAAPDSEDCAWLPDGTLLMPSGSRILAWKAGETAWREAADFTSAGLTSISRLAVSVAPGQPPRLAIVAVPQ
jgi:Tol biopolymer transport system component